MSTDTDHNNNNNNKSPSSTPSSSASSTVIWKHIGLHGHSVGTLRGTPEGLVWRSAVMSHNEDVSITKSIPQTAMVRAKWTVFGRSGHVRVETNTGNSSKLHHEFRFDGFPPNDFEKVQQMFQSLYKIPLQKHYLSSAGTSYGKSSIENRNLVFRHTVLEDANEEGEEFEPKVGDELLSLDLAEVSQCVLPGNNRNEIEIQFPESDTLEAGTDQLVSIRFYIPPDADFENNDKSTPSNAELFQKRILQNANIRKTTGDVLVEFSESQGTFLTPRGRYVMELYETFFRMRGNKYDYKIKYDDISRLFLLPKPDDVHMAFVISLDKPIRQGQQRYQMLVLQTNKETSEINVNIDPSILETEYNNDLQPVMKGSLSNLVAKTFKIIAKKKVFIPGKFANAHQQACVKCALRANEGLLYPLEKQFVFIHKPPVLVRFDEIESVEFQRYAGGQGSTRNFDLCVRLADTSQKEYTFSGIDRTDYTGLYNFLNGKKIRIQNLEGVGGMDDPASTAAAGSSGKRGPVYNEDEIYGVDGGGDEESEDDEDFDENEKGSGESSDGSEDIDDDDLGSEIDEDLDSDLEDARKNAIPKKRKSEAAATNEDDDDDMIVDDLPKKKKKKKNKSSGGSPAKPAASKPAAAGKTTKKKKKKDPNAPKKNVSAYMFFMKNNRSRLKEANPGATFGELAKIVSEEYKKLTPEGKQEYLDLEKEDKIRYQKEMANYTPPPNNDGDDDDDDDDDNDNEDDGGKKKKKAKAKKPKDPNEPKKPMSAYLLYSRDVRPEIRKEIPGIAFAEMAKEISKRFKQLSEEEQAKYDTKAKQAKQEYDRAMAAYKKAQKKKSGDDNDDDDDSDSDSD